MPVVCIKNPAELDGSKLRRLGEVPDLDGGAVSLLSGSERFATADGNLKVGVWEATPGKWRRRVMDPEFNHFLAGRATFVPDSGQPVDLQAGDGAYFPANSHGTWIIHETLRKTYVIFKTAASSEGSQP